MVLRERGLWSPVSFGCLRSPALVWLSLLISVALKSQVSRALFLPLPQSNLNGTSQDTPVGDAKLCSLKDAPPPSLCGLFYDWREDSCMCRLAHGQSPLLDSLIHCSSDLRLVSSCDRCSVAALPKGRTSPWSSGSLLLLWALQDSTFVPSLALCLLYLSATALSVSQGSIGVRSSCHSCAMESWAKRQPAQR